MNLVLVNDKMSQLVVEEDNFLLLSGDGDIGIILPYEEESPSVGEIVRLRPRKRLLPRFMTEEESEAFDQVIGDWHSNNLSYCIAAAKAFPDDVISYDLTARVSGFQIIRLDDLEKAPLIAPISRFDVPLVKNVYAPGIATINPEVVVIKVSDVRNVEAHDMVLYRPNAFEVAQQKIWDRQRHNRPHVAGCGCHVS